MSTWTCPRCLNTVVDQDVCSVCNTYQPPINTTASTINEKSNPMPQPSPINADLPQTTPRPSIVNNRFDELVLPDGTKKIHDYENDYVIDYTDDQGYIAYDRNRQEVYHIYPNGLVSLKTSDDNDIYNLDSGLTIDDMKRTMKFTNHDGNDYYVTDREITKKVEYNEWRKIVSEETYGNEAIRKEFGLDGTIKYHNKKNNYVFRTDWGNGKFKINDIFFETDGTFYTNGAIGTYTVDEDGNITCKSDDGNITVYGGVFYRKLKTVDKNGTVTLYEYDASNKEQTVTKNGKVTHSKINHIKYDEEAYDNILKTFNEISESKNKVVNICQGIADAIETFPDMRSSEGASLITKYVSSSYDAVSSLKEMTNYSILAYQACDADLIAELDAIIDSLFDEYDPLYAQMFKDEIIRDIENKDGILEYRGGTDFAKLEASIKSIESAIKSIEDINPEKLGLSKLELYEELKYIREKRGQEEYDKIIYALTHNCPKNFSEYNFKPGPLPKYPSYYDFIYGIDEMDNYQINSETININGTDIEFVQTLPGDCTRVERLAYDYTKANIINTMKTFPQKYMEAATIKSNSIVLTYDKHTQTATFDDENWGGYYIGNNLLSNAKGVVVINANNSLYAREYYTVHAVIHEYGHKFDDFLFDDIPITSLEDLRKQNMTDLSEAWRDMYDKYKSILPDIIPGGYSTEAMDAARRSSREFFAESMVAYFKEPAELKRLCPEVYNEISGLLGDDYGGAYSNSVYAQNNN